jgi:hypothetical protein
VKHLLFLLISLLVLAALAPSAYAQNSCASVFAKPSLIERVQERVLPARYVPLRIEAEQQALIEDADQAFRKSSIFERAAWRKVAGHLQWMDPFKTMFDLHEAAEKVHSTARQELQSLFQVLAFDRLEARELGLDQWTKSETHALALYQIMNLRGLPRFEKEIAYLRQHNLYFSDTKRQSSGALLTYSFEKEGRGKEITMFYRPAEKTEAEWFRQSDEARYGNIFRRKIRRKVFQPATVLAPTSLKPAFIGAFSFDGEGATRSWEITHKGYEISLHRTLAEIKEIAQLTHETHSFHVHAVFEMKKSDPRFESFVTWYKVMNDALYLRGLEEGLHGDEWVGPVELHQDQPEKESRFHFNVQRPEAVTSQDQKFFSAGLRGRIYGTPSSSQYVKLGIELRDTTRNLDQLARSMNEVSDALVSRTWEKLRDGDAADYARIITNEALAQQSLEAAGLRAETAAMFAKADRTVALPFVGLESKPLFNFKTGEYENASAALVARASSARSKYVEGLLALQTEIDDFSAKGEAVDNVDLQLAIQQTLTEWAKRAKLSERFHF